MLSAKVKRLKWRALLTDTLPYEVPVIFSNDRFFASVVANLNNPQLQNAFDLIVKMAPTGTIPYSYNIRKERGYSTTLGIIHPLCQLLIAEFYDTYAQSLLDCCKKSEFSLRRPLALTQVFSSAELSGERTFKLGIPHVDPAEGEMDVSHVTSFFVYGRYNLLGKFFDSLEFIDLEKRFSRLRTLDVSKCFFNIYTHAITWAAKSKSFSKEFRNAYSFEGHFDALMQRANYSETNGIVVGPEISRIFAEIIFQDIDRRIVSGLGELTINRDYAIRRYVDDYFIFANRDHHLETIERIVRRELERYKLFLNEKKIATSARPFVSQISLARRDIRDVLSALLSSFEGLADCVDPYALRKRVRVVHDKMLEIRLVVANFNVGFHTISGWLLTSLRGALRTIGAALGGTLTEDQIESIAAIVDSVLRVIFYVGAMDVRVRTTYSICQTVSVISGLESRVGSDRWDRLQHLILEELELLIAGLLSRDIRAGNDSDAVELYNLLICGAHHLGATFLRREVVAQALDAIVAQPLTYFGFVAAKFCFLKDKASFGPGIDKLNSMARQRIESERHKVDRDSETYLFLSDYLSSPDVSPTDKCELFNLVFSSSVSKKTMGSLSNLVGFVDWDGLRIEHLLARKELRPVYAWG